ncbi:hypothetical protein EYF80_055757 [Liparis tanakae]|uniref:Uncharacterized protein n=1 Tax=Liparis tanakae TaxID=230148 RepID=A0A4Z2EZ82_9TELE|nr:hypothetical protein EYF80_055757 [Liparis tanakae]
MKTCTAPQTFCLQDESPAHISPAHESPAHKGPPVIVLAVTSDVVRMSRVRRLNSPDAALPKLIHRQMTASNGLLPDVMITRTALLRRHLQEEELTNRRVKERRSFSAGGREGGLTVNFTKHDVLCPCERKRRLRVARRALLRRRDSGPISTFLPMMATTSASMCPVDILSRPACREKTFMSLQRNWRPTSRRD